jgi:S-adenosylmethionine decarboxylase proenzyme
MKTNGNQDSSVLQDWRSGKLNKRKNYRNEAVWQRGNRSQFYDFTISLRGLTLVVATTVLFAFLLGRATQTLLVESRRRAIWKPLEVSAVRNRSGMLESQVRQEPSYKLPNPTVVDGKHIPHTVYTSKDFEAARSLSSDSVHVHRSLENNCVVTETKDEQCITDPPHKTTDNHEEHMPAGQHVLADIKNVDAAFLNSKERLAQAMVDVVGHAGLTMLSYHCHALHPSGISCVAVLLESHISFHSWPDHGVILLDLFTCGSSSLLPLISIIKEIFGVPKPVHQSTDPPFMMWAHKLRGFRNDDEADSLSNDMGIYYLGVLELEMKENVS